MHSAPSEYDFHRRPHPGRLGGVLSRSLEDGDGEWNPGSSKLVGRKHQSPQPPQINAYLASRGLTTTPGILQDNSNGYAAGYANPINRSIIMATNDEYQKRLLDEQVSKIEGVLMNMTLTGFQTRAFERTPRKYRTPQPPKVYDKPPLYKIEELEQTKRHLQDEFRHFTFHQNKPFYKPMDNIIDFVERDPLVQAFTQIRPPPLPVGMNLSEFDYVKSCSRIQMNHLRLFNRPPREMPPRFQSAFRRAVQHVTEIMTLDHKLPMPTRDSLASVKYDGSKFAGLDYARQKLKTRNEAHEVALGDAQLVWDALLQGHRVRPHDTRLGGKGKLIEKKTEYHGRVALDNDDVSMGRLILMLSHRDLLILGSLEQKLTSSYLDARWPIYIGQSWYYGGAERFVNKMGRHAIYHCFDAKKFDAAIDGWLVKEALLILRQQYEGGMDPKYDTLWSFVYESLVEVVICRDDGIRMQKHCGTTSGNCFNTLVQSIITMMLGYTALIVRAEERMGAVGISNILTQCEIEVLGDDMVLALETPWMFLSRESLAEVVKECFNIDWSGKKSFTTLRLTDESTPGFDRFHGVQFLGMYFRNQRWGESRYAPKIVVPYRPFRESYLSLLFPKHGDYSREHSWLRAVGIYLNAAGNHETQAWLEAYLDFLELVEFVRPTAWPPGMEKMVVKDFWGLGLETPLPDRISIHEWMRIACIPRERNDDDT
ncbi:hypothetical protein BGX31_006560 [Mortierella sp. GBA43]|nr:hypothetical protein BGX31_006560 [Mortierella sp. GBA43]